MQGWLRVLTAGPRPTNPSELLASGGLSNLLAALEERCDLVIIDSPPVLPYTDAAVVASSVDATILVARPRASKLTSLRRALRTLRVVESNVAGVVLSELEAPVPATSGPRRGAVGATA
jgi:non-specific protein-tyrosine kinase